MKLTNKVVVITGGSRGLGAALAASFSNAGARVVVAGRNKKELATVASEYGVYPIVSDITKPTQVAYLAQRVVKKYKHIDIWINNAGTRIPHGPVEKINTRRMHQMMEVNLFGVVYGTQAVLPHMQRRRRGVIINILSTSALTGRANSAAYCASKYAATGFTKSLRLETAAQNISIIGVYPGGMRTHFFDEQKPAEYDRYMDPAYVARRIITNLKRAQPREELIIKRT